MKRKQEIENSINHLTCILSELMTKIDEKEEYNRAYNRLLIKRAELKKQLAYTTKTGKLISLFKDNLNSLNFRNKEKLICDYFSQSKF